MFNIFLVNVFRADLHMHTTLSPCGDLFMSPQAIVAKACEMGLDIIAITDHNTTRQSKLIKEIGEEKGLFVLCGAEVTTKEEVHCLCLFEDESALNQFQEYLDEHLPSIINDPDQFGYQVQVDKNEDICFQEERLLISAINQSIDQIAAKVHALNGLFIPAHVNKQKNSLISQLGFIPPDLSFEALELSRHITRSDFLKNNSYLKNVSFIQSSDAHFVDDIGSVYTEFMMEHRSFNEIKFALNNENGRSIKLKED